MKNFSLEKKIKKLKKLYIINFELKGFYISNWFFEIKKKKEKEIKPTQYLKTNWYVIPLPSEDDLKVKRTKKKILFYTKFQDLYIFYENFFKNQRLFFYFTLFSTYNPNKLYYLNKFDHSLKFEIYWMLKSIYCLLAETSFTKNFSKKYFSTKKFKFFSLVYFRDMFQKYWNPNLPLLWKKGENFTSKVEGTALLKLWEIIFWELVFEELNLPFKYSELDLKTFSLANIDPRDTWYYWKTWRLYLIGLSTHDGKITYNRSRKFYKNFSEIPTSEIKNDILLSLKKQILAQFLFWKEKLINLGENGCLFYNIDKMFSLNSNFLNLTPKIIQNFTFLKPSKYEQLNLFLENKFWKQTSLTYIASPIPEYYFGSKFEFLTSNYFSLPTEKLINDGWFSALFETDFNRFIKKFKLNDLKKISKIFYNNFSSYKIENFNKYFKKIILVKKSQKSSFLAEKSSFLVEKNSNLNPKKVLFLLKNNTKSTNNWLHQNYIYPLPDFIKFLFLLLIQVDIDSQDIDYFYINPFLHNLSDFRKAKKKAKEEMKENLSSLWTFEYYFKIAPLYNLSDPTLAYKIFMKNLVKFPNKDMCLRREEPFGLNPFEFTTKFLTKKDVPFPEAVDYYTYYKAKQKEKILTSKDTWPSENYTYFFIKILNFYSIFNSYKSCFFFLERQLWFKKKIYFFKSKCVFNFKIKKKFTFESNVYFERINGTELVSSLDFLWFNPINYNNFTENQLNAIWLKNSTKIKINFFTKILDKWKTQFIFSRMHNILSLNFIFQNIFTSKNILHSLIFNKNYYLKFNYFLNKKNYHSVNQFIIYKFNYMNFIKIYYFSKFFFYNFSLLFKLILKN